MKHSLQTATVASVTEQGIHLLFPDSAEPTAKAYPYNKAVSFSAGDRVFLLPTDSGYVVAFPIGPSPKSVPR